MSLDDNAHAGPSRAQRYPSAPRVSQIDADELDEGLVSMLGEKVGQALGNFKVSQAWTARTRRRAAESRCDSGHSSTFDDPGYLACCCSSRVE
jgi:hypothetical protein